MKQHKVVGRFAPSPTGPLHFGSLVVAVGSYCLARKAKGLWLLRIEDLDEPRIVPGAADDILFTLDNLGLHWDGEIVWQQQRLAAYQKAIESLEKRGLVYHCACSRKEILLSAPHPGEEGPVYPGTCRSGLPFDRKPRSLRLKVPSEQVCFTDGVFGPLEQVLSEAVGDFVLHRADGMFAYQLAVVIDDAESGVNQVVRGADLLPSTARQIYLHACLGIPVPKYIHLPLVINQFGEKISKRHGTIVLRQNDGGTELISAALRFLGQDVPKGLLCAPTGELLDWACQNIDPKRIPAESQGLLGEDFFNQIGEKCDNPIDSRGKSR